jgi:hypothetical protein
LKRIFKVNEIKLNNDFQIPHKVNNETGEMQICGNHLHVAVKKYLKKTTIRFEKMGDSSSRV